MGNVPGGLPTAPAGQALRDAGITQRQVATAAGVSDACVGHVLRGKRAVRRPAVLAAVEMLGGTELRKAVEEAIST